MCFVVRDGGIVCCVDLRNARVFQVALTPLVYGFQPVLEVAFVMNSDDICHIFGHMLLEE